MQSKSIDGKSEGKVHRGFKYALNDVWEDVVNYMKECETNKKQIYITGHSLGGAIAQILGLWFEDDAYEVQIFTFGSPAVIMEQIWEDGHFRVYLENDPVPFPPPFPYVHWGIRIHAETLDWDEDHPIGDVTKIDARDHSIKEYLKILRRHNGRL